MKIIELRDDLIEYIKLHQLEKKWNKVKNLFETNIRHPSLQTELLEPHWRGIYSFRIDNKYRALFFIIDDESIEVFAITNHYKK
jgi:Txe/YoeB family toxin of Txe-Axe toxin-antitoxin module